MLKRDLSLNICIVGLFDDFTILKVDLSPDTSELRTTMAFCPIDLGILNEVVRHGFAFEASKKADTSVSGCDDGDLVQ